MNNFQLFITYLRGHLKTICVCVLSMLILATVFFLYNVPGETILYAVFLCLLFVVIFMVMDFISFYRKHRELTEILHQEAIDPSALPEAATLIEDDYQDIISRLAEQQAHLMAQFDNSRSEMNDYYTMWAHQIKTPISAMNLLLKSEDTPTNTTLLAELFKIEQYVDMVLSYIRLDSDSTDFVTKPCSLVKAVRECIHKYARIFVMKKIRPSFNEEEFFVLSDEKWLSFVIEQLLSNALKYTPEGSITITIDRTQPALIITDTGIGIRPEDLPRVFDKGFTGYNGRSGRKSTGLGLYLCKRILTKLSHTITIESTPGQGTSVRIGLDTYKNVRFSGPEIK